MSTTDIIDLHNLNSLGIFADVLAVAFVAGLVVLVVSCIEPISHWIWTRRRKP